MFSSIHHTAPSGSSPLSSKSKTRLRHILHSDLYLIYNAFFFHPRIQSRGDHIRRPFTFAAMMPAHPAPRFPSAPLRCHRPSRNHMWTRLQPAQRRSSKEGCPRPPANGCCDITVNPTKCSQPNCHSPNRHDDGIDRLDFFRNLCICYNQKRTRQTLPIYKEVKQDIFIHHSHLPTVHLPYNRLQPRCLADSSHRCGISEHEKKTTYFNS